MFSTARRNGLPLSSPSSNQSSPQVKKNNKKQKNLAHSVPHSPSNVHPTDRPATASGPLMGFSGATAAAAPVSPPPRPLTADTAMRLPPSVPLSFPTPAPSPGKSLPYISVPSRSFASSSPSPLSSGLPSPTLPPLRLTFPSVAAPPQPSQPIAIALATPPTQARSPVINIGSASPVAQHLKDDFDYRVRSTPHHHHPGRPVQHLRKLSSNSVFSSSSSAGSPQSPSSPASPLSGRSRGSSSAHEDVLAPGDRVGAGLQLQGEILRRVDLGRPAATPGGLTQSDSTSSMQWERDLDGLLGLPSDEDEDQGGKKEPAGEFEVVRRLGAGSYAIVYLVREVLDRPGPGILDALDGGSSGDRSPAIGNGNCSADDFDLDEFESGMWDDDDCFGAGSDGAFYANDVDETGLDLDESRWREGAVRGRGSRRNRKERSRKRVYYGREYAVKVLSKVGMDEEALEAQLVEANIHQSLPAHPNIVTLHRTLETSSFLLLVLECVPGEDLFYFLEQARDHYEPEPPMSGNVSRRHLPNKSTTDVSVLSVGTVNTTRTPPTPSLLSTLNEKQLLGKRRLKLIASMFAQMCEAVAVCHDVGVYHRDIKPENFIVTDGWENERRVVIVKLTDFGLSTSDSASSDMDCGSAPYMSYECRNNCAPTYAPRAADVWSLGIVLINMLYHINPWTDTTQGVCPSFSSFLAAPEYFFMQRFAGMVPSVASFLARRVFCVLPPDDSMDEAGRRVSAREFGQWVKELPRIMASDGPVGVPLALADAEKALVAAKEESLPTSPTSPLSPNSPSSSLLAQSLAQVLAQQEAAAATGVAGQSSPAWRHRRGLSNASIGYSLSSVPQSRRPASRQASFSVADGPGVALRLHAPGLTSAGPASATGSRAATPLLRGRGLPRRDSAGPVSRVPSSCEPAVMELPTVFDEGEGDVSGCSISGVGAPALGLRLEPIEQMSLDERDREDERTEDLEHDHERETEHDDSVSREQSMARRRKRGARRGKGQIIQFQQQEIARLQQEHEEMARQLHQLQQTVKHVQSSPTLGPVPSIPSLINVALPAMQSPAATASADTLDTLASASEALARELSRTSRGGVGQNLRGPSVAPVAVQSQSHAHGFMHVLDAPHAHTQIQQTVPMRAISASAAAARDGSPARARAAAGNAALALASAGGPTPGALFPVSYASGTHRRSAPAPVPAPVPTLAAAYASSIVSSPTHVSSSDASSSGSLAHVASIPTSSIVKKTSKWKLSFGKSSSASQSRSPIPQVPAPAQVQVPTEVIDISRENAVRDVLSDVQKQQQQQQEFGRAGLSGPAEFASSSSSVRSPESAALQVPSQPSTSEAWPRGRKSATGPAARGVANGNGNGAVNGIGNGNGSGPADRWPHAERNVSPNSMRTGRVGPASGAGSAVSLSHSSVSSNWRNSTLTSSSAASAFTRYSNGSVKSVSSVATSVSGGSGGSWRTSSASLGRVPPPNVKIMTGVPWALDELPRQLQPNFSGEIPNVPPSMRKPPRARKPKDLPTINERPSNTPKSPLSQRFDAGRSSTELAREGRSSRDGDQDGLSAGTTGGGGRDGEREDGTPRKVQKGQINALAKMLSALRR
ncbi:hypothetical protein M0805_001584 [Coniferiporia weirii]|nr:hypothetical protein M0805_001584 [Coniferiporia weirii]